MSRIVGLGFLVLGIILIGWGVSASESVSSSFSKLFTGSPTNKAVYLMIGGAILAMVGIGALIQSPRPPR